MPEFAEQRFDIRVNDIGFGASDQRCTSAAAKERARRNTPPEPWESWQQLKEARELVSGAKYLLSRKGQLDEKDSERLAKLEALPIGTGFAVIRRFTQSWYLIWADENGKKRTYEAARLLWDKFANDEGFKTLKALKLFQRKLSPSLFERLATFLQNPAWKPTSNAAERCGRKFRKIQKGRYNFRTPESIDIALRRMALKQFETSAKDSDSNEPETRAFAA